MAFTDSTTGVRQADPHILHHALIFVIQNMAVQDKVADIALVLSANYHFVGLAHRIFHP